MSEYNKCYPKHYPCKCYPKPYECDHYYKKCYCKCKCNCGCDHKPKCSEQEIIDFLGLYLLDILKDVKLPCGHPSLEESICLLIKGKQLPPGHPTLDEIICKALNCCCKYK